jgi:hypothetical protein
LRQCYLLSHRLPKQQTVTVANPPNPPALLVLG